MTGAAFTRREAVAGGLCLVAQPALAEPCRPLPSSTPLNFLALGDWGRKGNRVQRTVAGQMTRVAQDLAPRFVVTTGDNFYTFGVSGVEDAHWTRSFEEVYSDPSLDIPWFPTLGNHDYGGDVDAQVCRSAKCRRWQMDGRWYWRAGNTIGMAGVDLFFIDTIIWTGGEKFPFSLLGSRVTRELQAKQRRWLESRLLLSRAPIKIVFGHYPIYSVGKHGGSMKMWDLDQLLRRAGVCAYVCGHDHCTYHIEAAGMHYICSGGGSQALPTFTGDPWEPSCVIPNDCIDRPDELPRPKLSKFRPETGFASFSTTLGGVTVHLYDGQGEVYNCVEIAAPAGFSAAL